MDIALLARLNAARAERRAGVVVTSLESGESRLIDDGASLAGDPLSAEIGAAIRTGKSKLLETPDGEIFLTVSIPPPRIVVVGAVHISQALAPIAAVAGYDLLIVDPRTAFATEARFDGVRLIADWPENVMGELALDPYTALAALTHDPKIDDVPLAAALAAGCFYVGALGSRKTHAKRCERLAAAGVGPAALETIRAPIGLDIGAASPAEIAVAVMAEIIDAFRRRPLPGLDAGAAP